jgi:hypothetical protein
MQRISRLVRRSLVGGSVIALSCALGVGAQAANPTPGTLVQVTGPDPFTTCTADQVNSQESAYGSILFPNTSIEPWVVIDPTDSKRLLTANHQDRWNDGGARGLVGNVSKDGGGTWAQTIPGGVTECTGGSFGRASDPWLTFTPDGTAFFFSLVLDPAQPLTPFGARNSGLLVSRSMDGGETWGAPTTLLNNKSSHVLNDKTSITADPTAQGHVYAVWDQLSVFPGTVSDAQSDELLAGNDGVEIARQLAGLTASAGGAPSFKFSFTGPSFLSMTADNGNNWSTAVPIFQPGTNAQTIDNIVVVEPSSGDLLDFFTVINFTNSPTGLSIDYIRSTDKGATWSAPPATQPADIHVVGVVTPDSGGPIRDASILYSIAVDPTSGAIYLVWQDDRFSDGTCTTPTGSIPVDGIVFSQSTDGGLTWSTPVQINQTPPNPTHRCREQAFIPAVVAAGDGTIVVTYYDFRNDTDTGGVEGTDYFAVFCKPATPTTCSNAAKWGSEVRLTDNTFNILDAPIARGHFLGDYMGLAASGQTVYPVFGLPTGHNLTADFIRTITLP